MAIDFALTLILVLLLAVAVGIILPALAIASDRSDRSMPRTGWWQWTGIFLAFVIVMSVLEVMMSLLEQQARQAAQWTLWGVIAIFLLILPWVMARRFLWRVRDAGWNPKLAYLCILPLINLIPWLLLLFLPTASAPQEKSSDQ